MRTFAEAFLEETGHPSQTTLWDDFSIADRFGLAAVKDTYRRAKQFCGSDPLLWGEFSIVLNWRCWQHWHNGRVDLAELYGELAHRSADDFYATEPGEVESDIYFKLTD